MTVRQSPTRTPPEVEAEIVRLVPEGQTRGQVAKTAGVHPSTVSRVVRDIEGLEFARTGSSSSGTSAAMAKARGVRSEYTRNRRAALSDRILDATEKTLDLLEICSAPRERQFLSQALRNHMAAYADLTALDAKAAPDLTVVVSMFDNFLAGLRRSYQWWTRLVRPHPGLTLRASSLNREGPVPLSGRRAFSVSRKTPPDARRTYEKCGVRESMGP